MVAQGHVEGQSVNRPPLFDGEDYHYWKTRMKFFLQGLDFQLWTIIEEGDLKVSNIKDKWTNEDKKKLSQNSKAKSILCCSLSKKEFNRISACKSTKEMWDKLRLTHEGSDKVKETIIDILVAQYERFQMQSGESISQMYSRFTDITNGLAGLGKTYEVGDMKYQSGRRYFKKGREFKISEGKEVKRSEPICYECKKPGRIKAECPKLKKTEFKKKDNMKKFKKYKKKAMTAAWNNESELDSESSSNEEEEEKANLAFMANIDDKGSLRVSKWYLDRRCSRHMTGRADESAGSSWKGAALGFWADRGVKPAEVAEATRAVCRLELLCASGAGAVLARLDLRRAHGAVRLEGWAASTQARWVAGGTQQEEEAEHAGLWRNACKRRAGTCRGAQRSCFAVEADGRSGPERDGPGRMEAGPREAGERPDLAKACAAVGLRPVCDGAQEPAR
ncbi:hypothetical protein Taro_012266 [Colocasia esculenta]|uniref:DUF4219 domain-containing protein n=1 Tax=Colocasia esculenta TaxID=4460 RepID=A0A843U8B4_COLES|nr:hypothetical protein [Colocasia esculenta]